MRDCFYERVCACSSKRSLRELPQQQLHHRRHEICTAECIERSCTKVLCLLVQAYVWLVLWTVERAGQNSNDKAAEAETVLVTIKFTSSNLSDGREH